MKRRLGSKASTGIFYMERPFFDVDVQLQVLVLGWHAASSRVLLCRGSTPSRARSLSLSCKKKSCRVCACCCPSITQVPHITLNPTLNGIQDAINSTAKAILQARPPAAHARMRTQACLRALQPCCWHACASAALQPWPHCRACCLCLCLSCSTRAAAQASRKLRCWGMPSGPLTYYDLIARDKEVVRAVLLLAGCVEGVKAQVSDYLSAFDKYAFLWTSNLQVRARGRVGEVGGIGHTCRGCKHAWRARARAQVEQAGRSSRRVQLCMHAAHSPISAVHAALALWHPTLPLCGDPGPAVAVAGGQAAYDAFMATSPSLEAFEGQLKQYMAIENEIAAIPAVHNIGAGLSRGHHAPQRAHASCLPARMAAHAPRSHSHAICLRTAAERALYLTFYAWLAGCLAAPAPAPARLAVAGDAAAQGGAQGGGRQLEGAVCAKPAQPERRGPARV